MEVVLVVILHSAPRLILATVMNQGSFYTVGLIHAVYVIACGHSFLGNYLRWCKTQFHFLWQWQLHSPGNCRIV